MKKILVLVVIVLITPLCISAQKEIRYVIPETTLLVEGDPYISLYDPVSKSSIVAFKETRKFIMYIENRKDSVSFPPEISEKDTFWIIAMNRDGFSIKKIADNSLVLGFDFKSKTWIAGKMYNY